MPIEDCGARVQADLDDPACCSMPGAVDDKPGFEPERIKETTALPLILARAA